ncbi:3',5'-cyclic-AMP phosphodiesterase [Microcoleus sp. FACHB-1515]|uniref:3',5'-cyclic-AMP phosphodiesterase n=1 Tax=Cyanophyceae TaxID=3028117 RepID=UPI001689C95E|nr:3',5'-cyclic-AMP phosphodiesterase [Microcoleus sp. FACHB-1515]MBD2090789.1 3',5'-cyclic-AMP phosphodiesterase [Microcoleus sp. FACHB-1515]
MMKTSPLVVAQLSDTHLFADRNQTLLGLSTARSLEGVLQQIKQLQPQPDLLLLTGDLSQDETPTSYERLRKLVAPLGLPTYWLAGNHDQLALVQWIPDLAIAPFSADKQFFQGDWNFLLLNSAALNCVHGELSNESIDWLETQLEANPHPTLIALHHPPLPIASEWMDNINLKNAAALIDAIDRHPQVKVVLFGHIHQEFDQQRRNARYLGAPSTCVQFKPRSRDFTVDELKPGFRLLSLYPDGSIATQVQRIQDCPPLDLTATGY